MSLIVEKPNDLDRKHFFIDGRWVKPTGGRTRNQVEAATGEVIGIAAMGSEADIDAAVRAARRALDDGPWGKTSPQERAEVMRRFARELDLRSTYTSELVSRENGMPIGLSQMLNGGAPSVLLNIYADVIENLALEEVRTSQAGSTIVRREPVGVVGAIAPWNFPQALAMFKIAPALAAGCTVVLKPSPETALDSYDFADAAKAAGLPDGVLTGTRSPPPTRLLIERAARNQLLAAAAYGEVRPVDDALAAESHDFLLKPTIVRASFAMFARRIERREGA